MEPTNTPPMNTPASSTPQAPKKHHILAPIVIILMIVIAALFVLGMMRAKQSALLDQQIQDKQTAIAETDTQVQALGTQGTSSDPSQIEADLRATNIDGIDQ